MAQERLQTLSSLHLGRGAVSTFLSAKPSLPAGLPSTSPPWVGFIPSHPSPHSIAPHTRPPSQPSSPCPPAGGWPQLPSPHRLDKEASPSRLFRRRATCTPLHRKPVSLHFAIFHFASLPPGDSNVSSAPQALTRHNKRWAGASGSSQGTGGPLPTAGDRLHYSGQHLSFLKERRGSRTKGRREGLVRSHQH